LRYYRRPPAQGDELGLSGIGELADTDLTATAVETAGLDGSAPNDDPLVFDVNALLDAPAILAAGLVRPLDRRGHPVDRQEPEFTQQLLVVDPSKGGVIDHPLGTRHVGRESPKAVHGCACLSPGFGNPLNIKDHAGALLGGTGGHDHELGAPGRLAGALEVKGAVTVVAQLFDLTGGLVGAGLPWLGPKQRGDDLAVCIEHARQMGMGP